MRILVAPDSFKGSLSSEEAAQAIREGLEEAFKASPNDDRDAQSGAEIVTVPLSDGGEGFVSAYAAARQAGKSFETEVSDSAGNPRVAKYFLEGDCATIEMAEAAGLEHIDPDAHDVWTANTYGVGQLIAAARSQGASEIIVGLGGSATTDGGVGMLAALGVRFLDEDGAELAPEPRNLHLIRHVDTTNFHATDLRVTVAADVTNPLTGDEGAAAVFGPQKGATKEDVPKLDEGLRKLSDAVDPNSTERRDTEGAGAAGGLGWALMRFFNARMVPGFDILSEAANLDSLVSEVDLVITGEGKVDSQTLSGKAPAGIWNLCKKYDVPLVIFGGAIDDSFQLDSDGAKAASEDQTPNPALVAINPADQSLEEAIANAETNMRNAARELGEKIVTQETARRKQQGADASQQATGNTQGTPDATRLPTDAAQEPADVDTTRPQVGAIILAGGGGRRLGGFSKSDLTIDGTRFLDQIISTLRADGVPDSRIVVVGPDSLDVPEGIALTFEDPPRGGPSAGIVAGLKFLGYEGGAAKTDDLVLITTCDAPFSASARRVLVDALEQADADVAAVRDRAGVLQQLLAVYRVQGLLDAIAKAPRTHNRAVKKLVADLEFIEVEVDPHMEIDVDTWDDYKRLQATFERFS